MPKRRYYVQLRGSREKRSLCKIQRFATKTPDGLVLRQAHSQARLDGGDPKNDADHFWATDIPNQLNLIPFKYRGALLTFNLFYAHNARASAATAASENRVILLTGRSIAPEEAWPVAV